MYSKFKRLARTERGPAIAMRLVQRLLERLGGRLRAALYGWPGGFIGAAPRIIGTRHIRAGQGASIGRHAWIETIAAYGTQQYSPRIDIGERFSASERLHIACIDRVSIGADCLLGSSVHISDHNHGGYKGARHSPPTEPPIQRPLVSSGPVQIGARVWIGDNVVILGPARIGDGAIVGANSVVSGEVAAHAIVVGAPARVVKVFNAETGRWEPQRCAPVSPGATTVPHASQ